MKTGILHKSKNDRWIITKGAFDNVTCAWNVRDSFEKKRIRITASCEEGETIISENASALPSYILKTIAKLQSQHQADLLKSVPATAREEAQ